VAHTISAKKRIRQNVRHRARNHWRKSQIKESIRQFDEALKDGNTDKAAQQLNDVYKQLDKVAAKGTIHKKTASRKKSRLAKRLHEASQG
jgi:small subunit ribosomal protein S20